MFNLSKLGNAIYNFRTETAFFWKKMWTWGFFKVYLLIFVILEAIISYLAAYIYLGNKGNDLTVLHYNIDFGIDQIGAGSGVFKFPITVLFLFLADLIFLYYFTRSKDFKFLVQLVLGASLVITGFLFLATLGLYIINFR